MGAQAAAGEGRGGPGRGREAPRNGGGGGCTVLRVGAAPDARGCGAVLLAVGSPDLRWKHGTGKRCRRAGSGFTPSRGGSGPWRSAEEKAEGSGSRAGPVVAAAGNNVGPSAGVAVIGEL